MKTRLILVGGFLGAGKTTLLLEAAKRTEKQGYKVGLITNDQAPDLVDTTFLQKRGVSAITEVTGSCFCCNFPGLEEAIRKLRQDWGVDLILAEPVGSCTDLSATIAQPIKDKLLQEITLAPLTVLVDPFRIKEILWEGLSGLHPSAQYILKKQMEEADIIAISKADLLSRDDLGELKEKLSKAYSNALTVHLSSITGEGVEEWLRLVTEERPAGQTLATVDYDTYAEGEAVLGWLNANIELEGKEVDWNALIKNLMEGLASTFVAKGLAVGHLKTIIVSEEDTLIANLTGDKQTLSIRGHVKPSSKARLILNARVQTTPQDLERIVKDELKRVYGSEIKENIIAWSCLSPGRPNPTFRYFEVVEPTGIPRS